MAPGWGCVKLKEVIPIAWDYDMLAATNFLDRYAADDGLESVMIRVETPFNAGVTATVGFPGDVSGVLATTDIDLQTAGIYEATVCKYFTTTQTLNLYITGTPTVGRLVTFVVSS